MKCAVLVLALAGLAAPSLAAPAVAQSGVQGRILVIPFEGGGDPRGSWLGEGVAMLLADDLNGLGGDAITRDERVRTFTRLQVPPLATLARGTIVKVGQLVGATTVVTGRLKLSGEAVVVRAQALRIDTGRLVVTAEQDGPLTDLLTIVERVARRLLPEAKVPSAQLEEQHASLPAFENYVKGLLAGAPKTEVSYLEKAIAREPAFHRARVALARAHADAGNWAKARTAALAVPGEAPAWARAQFLAALAEIQLEQYDAAFGRLKALERREPAPEILNNLGVIQLRREATPQAGRATYYFTKATDADNTQADYYFNLGYAYWLERDLQAAIYWLREAVRRQPADGDAHFVLAAALSDAGSATEAAREKELAVKLSSEYEEWEQQRKPGEGPVPADLERLRAYIEPPGARRADSALVATEQREQREVAAFHLQRGRRLYETEHDREALIDLRRVIFLSPYEAGAHLLVGRIHLRAGRLRDAIDALKIALWSEETVPAHVTLGTAYLRQKDFGAAREEAERALELAPRTAEAERLLEEIARAEAEASQPSGR